MRYNYLENMKEDILQYVKENYNTEDYTKEDMETRLYDELWDEDSVTGNASGSYTFNSWKAQDNLTGNYDLLVDAYKEFGYDTINIEELDNYEKHDVTIRCYLLGEAISETMKELYY